MSQILRLRDRRRVGIRSSAVGQSRIAAALALAVIGLPATAAPLTWAEIQSMSLPPEGQKIFYGKAAQQFGILRIGRSAAARKPVVMLLHGGCWSKAFSYRYFEHLAAALPNELPVASWNVEYRRIGDTGGGWPGTFEDVHAAFAAIQDIANTLPIDPDRVVVMGHSAGGHLALWLGARLSGKRSDTNRRASAPAAVIGLAPITDLVRYSRGPGGCNAAVKALMNGDSQHRSDRYQIASPAARLPLGVPQWLIQGQKDPIVRPGAVRQYATAAKTVSDRVELVELPDAGHFEPSVPTGLAWQAVIRALRKSFGLTE